VRARRDGAVGLADFSLDDGRSEGGATRLKLGRQR